MKKRILFVCLGNICRSPAAEGVFKSIVESHGRSNDFEIDSAGTSGYHQGELADKRMREHAKKRGLDLTSRSRQLQSDDLKNFDYIVVMDEKNLKDALKLASPEQAKKVVLMTDYCQKHKVNKVPDPYWGGASGFEEVLNILEDACEHFYKTIQA